MPALPEVEIGAQLLRDRLLHRRVRAIQEGPQRPLKGQDTAAFQSTLVGLTCAAVERHGKLLMTTFEGKPQGGGAPQSWRLFCQFAMSGRFLLRAEGEPPQRSCRFSVSTEGGGWIDHLSHQLQRSPQSARSSGQLRSHSARSLLPSPRTSWSALEHVK